MAENADKAEAEALGQIKSELDVTDEINTVNGVPNLADGSTFLNKFAIDSRVGWDDTLGASYYALALSSPDKELVLHINSGSKTVKNTCNLFVEAAVLKTAESKNKHLLFTQIHSYDLTAKYPWLAVYNRGGPTVSECLDFGSGKFSHGTAGRFALDVLNILDFLHSNAFLATNLNIDLFCLDPCSRNVFLNELGYIRADPSKRNLLVKLTVVWRGTSDFAPLAHHGKAEITQWDELEAFFYFFYSMVVGSLPWTTKYIDEVETMKLMFGQEDNFKDLPAEYLQLWNQILDLKHKQDVDYSPLKETIKQIYEKCGGVTNMDMNYDFEVDFPDIPEEEMPRFVLEKRPIEENDAKDEVPA